MIESRPGPPPEVCRRVKIHEADAKSLLLAQGLPVPAWEVARTPTQARAAAVRFLDDRSNATGKVVIKAQVLVGGRGKAGGVRLAGDRRRGRGRRGADPRARDQGPARAARPGRRRRPRSSRSTTSRSCSTGRPAASCSSARPRAASRSSRSPSTTPRRSSTSTPTRSSACRTTPRGSWRSRSGSGPTGRPGAAVAKGLLRTMLAFDADLVEINPLAVIREHNADGTPVERLVCLDAKITLDDSALARHPAARGAARPRRGGPHGRRGAPLRPDVHQARRATSAAWSTAPASR